MARDLSHWTIVDSVGPSIERNDQILGFNFNDLELYRESASVPRERACRCRVLMGGMMSLAANNTVDPRGYLREFLDRYILHHHHST